MRVHHQVPRFELLQPHLCGAPVTNLPNSGRNHRFDRIVKCEAILGRVIKPVVTLMTEVAEVRKARIARDTMPQVHEPIVDRIYTLPLLIASLRTRLPRSVTQVAVGLFEVAPHLDESLFLSLERDFEATHDLR